MRFLLLAILLYLETTVDALPQDPVDTLPNVSLSTDSTDLAFNDVASANTPLASEEQSSPIPDDLGLPIAITAPVDSKDKDEDSGSLISTNSVGVNDDDRGLLVAMSQKEDIVTPTILDRADTVPSCPVQKAFHCCYIKQKLLFCLAITSPDQPCRWSGNIQCCAGTKPHTAPRRNSKYGVGKSCGPVIWSPKPPLGEQVLGSVRDNAPRLGNFLKDSWGNVLHSIKELQEKVPPGNEYIQPDNYS